MIIVAGEGNDAFESEMVFNDILAAFIFENFSFYLISFIKFNLSFDKKLIIFVGFIFFLNISFVFRIL